jgi:EpsD family peptidyl-prolyl cis-trans isomerase
MNSFRAGLLAAAGCVALAGCHLPDWLGGAVKAPTGQVVATVGAREITLRELRLELGNQTFADDKARKRAEQLALRNIIGRVILADAAKTRGLDRTPDYLLQKRRVIDSVLAESLQQKLTSEVPQASSDEIQSFITSHPDVFLERKIFIVDQIRTGRISDPAIIKALEPLKTLDEVEDVLKNGHMAFQRVVVSLDAVGIDPGLVEKIARLPPHEVFAVPGSDGVLINEVRETKVEPFVGDAAFKYAQSLTMRERTQEAVKRTYGEIMAKARPTVRFNKDYAPQPPPLLAPAAPASPNKGN